MKLKKKNVSSCLGVNIRQYQIPFVPVQNLFITGATYVFGLMVHIVSSIHTVLCIEIRNIIKPGYTSLAAMTM